MAKEDLGKFRELLISDAEFQKKLIAAAENYSGDPEEQKVFEEILLPIGEEHGLSATYEEFKAYIDSFSEDADAELSEDELAQVAGGKVNAGGIGGMGCDTAGIGLGGGGGTGGGGFCLGIGVGQGGVLCLTAGISPGPDMMD